MRNTLISYEKQVVLCTKCGSYYEKCRFEQYFSQCYAFDLYNVLKSYTDFGSTKEYEWLKINAHLYGFIIRYTKDNTNITGYKDEPWHIRYVGIENAKYIYENGITLEEYLLNK